MDNPDTVADSNLQDTQPPVVLATVDDISISPKVLARGVSDRMEQNV